MDIQNKNALDTTKLKAFFNFLIPKWWIIYGLSLAMFFLWLAILLFGPPIPKPADEIVFYPWISLGEVGAVNSMPLVLFILGIVLYALKKKSFRAALLLAAVTIFFSVVVLALLGPHLGRTNTLTSLDPTLTHVDTMRSSEYVYNLARYQSIFGIRQYYILYKCDSLGVSCHAIYRYEPESLDDDYADIDNPPFISSDAANIMVHIAGKVVYTFPTASNP